MQSNTVAICTHTTCNPHANHQYISKCDNNSANTGVYSIIGCFGINRCDNALPCHCTIRTVKHSIALTLPYSVQMCIISCACVYSSRVCPRMRDTRDACWRAGVCADPRIPRFAVWGGGLGAAVWLALPPPISIFFINKVHYML